MKRSFVIAAALLLSSIVAHAEERKPGRSYPVPGHGAVQFSVPADWTERVRATGGAPPTIELTAPKGEVTLLITAMWSPDDHAQFNSAENIRAAIEQSAKSVQSTAVEKELVLRPIATASGKGHFFWATDRAPKAGEYEFMANGAVPAGNLLLSFTALSHVAPPEGIQKALAIVQSAVQAP